MALVEHFNVFCTSENRNKYSTVYSLDGLMTSLPHHKIFFIQLLLMTSSEDEIWQRTCKNAKYFLPEDWQKYFQTRTGKKHIRLLMQTLRTTGSIEHTLGSSWPQLSGNEDNFAAAAILW